MAMPACCQFPQRPTRCRWVHSRQTALSSFWRSRITRRSAVRSASSKVMPRSVKRARRSVNRSISAVFIAGLCGQQWRSGSNAASGAGSFAAVSEAFATATATVATVGGLNGSCVAKVAGVAAAGSRKLPFLISVAKLTPATPGESGSGAFSPPAPCVPGQAPPVPALPP